MIRVVAWTLAARKGSKESCNCRLGQPENTDNHIVLVDDHTLKLTAKATKARPATATHNAVKARSAAFNTLKKREAQSQTAEFTPRVRLDHQNLVGQDLQDLIKAQGGKLLVRVTGLQMYDSEHAFGRKLRGHSSDCMGKELNLALALSLIGRGFNGHPVRRLAFHRIPNRFECPDLAAACLL